MTSILKADTIQDTDGNNIINESGNTITIGASGDTTNIIGTLQNNGAAVGGDLTPSFFAYQGSGQVIPHATNTVVTLDTELYDTDNAFSSNTFTVPSGEGGKYFFTIGLRKDNFSSTRTYIYLEDGSGNGLLNVENAGGGNYDTLNGSVILNLSAGDTLQMKVYQGSGGSNNSLSGKQNTFFGGFKMLGV
tara:strand:+ start:1271 stop:1840 length:570 start_codon:yes stop_codon:yes gene_type:complete